MNKLELAQIKLRLLEQAIKLSENREVESQGRLSNISYRVDYKKTKEIYNELIKLIIE